MLGEIIPLIKREVQREVGKYTKQGTHPQEETVIM
jgi:hypothetical protein